jgi:hypothetical protein
MSKHRKRNSPMTRPHNFWMDEQAQRIRDAWPRPVLVPWVDRYASADLAVSSVNNGLRFRLRRQLHIEVQGDNLLVRCNDVRRPEDARDPRPVGVEA